MFAEAFQTIGEWMDLFFQFCREHPFIALLILLLLVGLIIAFENWFIIDGCNE